MICPHCQKPITFRVTDEQKKKVFRLRRKGFSTSDIVTLAGVSQPTVIRILKESRKKKKKKKS